jgi:signal peptidase I
MRIIRELAITIIIAVGIFFVLQVTIQSSVVVGSSMEPTLQNGQRLLISKVSYAFYEPERGDIIVFRPPDGSAEFVKRIIGLPGDEVEIKSGKVHVNSVRLTEPYIVVPPRYTLDVLRVPDDSYFVLGDNRNNSNDSHKGWFALRKDIVGKAWITVWPPGEWGAVPNYDLNQELVFSTD